MKLNTAQQKAVSIKNGPALVLAGPGSGKTAVITHRLGALLKAGISGNQILVITFTRAAASEMRDRFRRMFPEYSGSGVTFGTFHSVFYMMLKKELGLTNANIASETEKRRVMGHVLEALHMSDDNDSGYIKNLLDKISLIKALGDENVLGTAAEKNGITDMKDFSKIRTAYLREMASRRLVDYDDMILMIYKVFNARPESLDYWRGVFNYILVDEFQDVNVSQYNVLKQLMPPGPGKGANLFVVGDDDQSIYGFRGASSETMLRFPKDYPDTQKVLLNINYRCAGEICRASLRLISNNKARFNKSIQPEAAGGQVVFQHFTNPREENEFIVSEIKRLHDEGLPYSEMAAIYRTSRTYRSLRELLKQHNIPFMADSVLPSIYNHWIGEDIFAYLRIFSGGRLRKDFLKIINKPSRYVKREAFTCDVVDFSKLRSEHPMHPKTQEAIDVLAQDVKFASRLSPYSAINYLRKGMGYDAHVSEFAAYHGFDKEEFFTILDELQEDALACRSTTEWLSFALEKARAEGQAAAEVPDKISGSQGGEAVRLSTIHGAKGLEYATVFIPDAIEGLLPHKNAASPEETEEERRLFYVAATRAKRRLYVLSTSSRFNRPTVRSRFISEAQGH